MLNYQRVYYYIQYTYGLYLVLGVWEKKNNISHSLHFGHFGPSLVPILYGLNPTVRTLQKVRPASRQGSALPK